MRRIWNALRYGDSETRKCIGSVILFVVIALVCIIISGISGKFGLFIIGMLAGVIALIISQTFTLEDDDFVAEVNGAGKKDTVRSVSVKRNGVTSATSSKAEAKGNSEADQMVSEKERIQDHTPVAEFEHYNPQLMKKIIRKYHVKKDHRPIVIDSSEVYHIKECPAFIWRVHNKVFLLLLEKEPRRICISRDRILHMGYVPKVRADRSKEYLAFQKENMVTNVFGGYLPDYFDSKAQNVNLKYKNLYEIYPDIRLSNRSAFTVMDLLYLHFMPEDKITQSEKFNGYFKRIYAAHIMYQDRVYSITEYKDAVEQVLKELTNAEMPKQEFVITLENLVKGRMISQEYADHYMDMRGKVRGKQSR